MARLAISTNPSKNFEVIGKMPVSDQAFIEAQVKKARSAQKSWQNLGLEKRIEIMRSLNALFETNKDEFIKRTSEEMGMPLGLSTSIVDSAIETITWNCDHAPEYLKSKTLYEDDKEITEIRYEPRGVVGCIVAWNFPLGNFAMSLSQALLAGNSAVMKYSEEVPLFAAFLESIIVKSDLPEGVVNFVYGDGEVGAILAQQDVDFLSFTGSSQTGQKIYQYASEKMTPVALELGGSSPGIVFEDCTLGEDLISTIFWKRFLNTAQFCDGLKRLLVHESLFEECVEKLVTYANQRVIGDALDPKTELGPLVAERQVIKLEEQIKDALDKGATLECGGKSPDGLQGAFYTPTILTNIRKDMRVWREEVFGPALPVLSFSSYDEAIALANDTAYGLSASIFTNNKTTLEKAMTDIKAGSIDNNTAHYFRPQNPFGGYKCSGIGRQGGEIGFHEVCQVKTCAYEK